MVVKAEIGHRHRQLFLIGCSFSFSAVRSVIVDVAYLIRVPFLASAYCSDAGLRWHCFMPAWSARLKNEVRFLSTLMKTQSTWCSWPRSGSTPTEMKERRDLSFYAVKLFPSCGVGIAVVLRASISSHLTVKSDFAISTTSFHFFRFPPHCIRVFSLYTTTALLLSTKTNWRSVCFLIIFQNFLTVETLSQARNALQVTLISSTIAAADRCAIHSVAWWLLDCMGDG